MEDTKINYKNAWFEVCEKKKLKYDSLDIFFRYDKELFDEELLKKIGNPKEYNLE